MKNIWPIVRINVHVAPYVCDNCMLPAYCTYWYIVNQFVNDFYELYPAGRERSDRRSPIRRSYPSVWRVATAKESHPKVICLFVYLCGSGLACKIVISPPLPPKMAEKTWQRLSRFYTASVNRITLPEAYHGAHASICLFVCPDQLLHAKAECPIHSLKT